jgi:tyrosyl-tRNA synthetase
VLPLITTASGTKFGKTEVGNDLARSESRRRPYEFYQFWFNTDDRDAVRYLKFFTFLDAARIAELERRGARSRRSVTRSVSSRAEVTTLVHGADAVRAAEAVVGERLQRRAHRARSTRSSAACRRRRRRCLSRTAGRCRRFSRRTTSRVEQRRRCV